MLQCLEGTVSLAITGGDFAVEHAGHKINSWTILTIRKGERLAIRAGHSGSWAYLAFAGAVQSDVWLESQATHSTSGFGGGALSAGQALTISDIAIREDRQGDIIKPDFVDAGPIRVVTGPQDQHFATSALEQFTSAEFKVTDAYDRMGMRLNGPELALNGALSIPSEPIVRGSVQVSGDGVPTVLLADHQTTGGYPKIATVISCDIDRTTQFRAGQTLRFKSISSDEAVNVVRHHLQEKIEYLQKISVARGSLEQRLMRDNLIHGCIYD